MPVLDTSFIVGLLRGKSQAQQKLTEMEAEGDSFSTTEINVLRLYRGTLSKKYIRILKKSESFWSAFRYGNLKNQSMRYLLSSHPNCFRKEKQLGHLMN